MIDNQEIRLTKKEKLLINLFLSKKNQVITYEKIESYVWEGNFSSLESIRSLIRRKGEVIDSTLSHGDLSLHLKSAELSSGINTVKLALKEFLIMEMLLQNPHQIITKERIIDKIWGGDSEAEYNNVEVYISFLRKKIQFLGAETEIRTSRGIGYSLE